MTNLLMTFSGLLLCVGLSLALVLWPQQMKAQETMEVIAEGSRIGISHGGPDLDLQGSFQIIAGGDSLQVCLPSIYLCADGKPFSLSVPTVFRKVRHNVYLGDCGSVEIMNGYALVRVPNTVYILYFETKKIEVK